VSQPDAAAHPCLRCGACCATFRVAFHWLEIGEASAEDAPAVPAALVQKLDPHRVAMRGTDQPDPRCEQLQGEIGSHAWCGIYRVRPSPCRELQPSFYDGLTPSPQCDRARARFGLPPLTAADFVDLPNAGDPSASGFGQNHPAM
jgi:hypothetical protein